MGTAHVHRPKVLPRRVRSQEIAAVERREASVADATQGARWRLRAYVTGPPTGAAAPERLSALRSPRFCDGGLANLGGHFASRER